MSSRLPRRADRANEPGATAAVGGRWVRCIMLSTIEQRVVDHLAPRREELIEDLARLVAIPTGGWHRAGLDQTRQILCARLASLGAIVRTVEGDPRPDWLEGPTEPVPTAVCERRLEQGPHVLIAGHLDTVHDPNGDFRTLTIRPDGKTATGPGCVDMKGGLVLAVAALEALEACGVRISWTFLMNSDEETGSFCSDRALRDEARRHDVGLALEPAMTKGELAIERGGSGQFVVDVRGRSAHVGRAFGEGVSAVYALGGVLTKLAAMVDVPRGKIVNVGPLRGGSATNVVPDRAMAWGNLRFASPEVAAELERELAGLASPSEEMGRRFPFIGLSTSFNRPAKPLTDGTRRLAELARATSRDLGRELPFASTGGVCDGNILQAEGLPTIDTLGVRGGGLHTLDEWVELDSLVDRAQLLALLMIRVAQAKRG